jgi:hypothetical protein
MMRRPLLLLFAALFFAYEQWSFYTWMQMHGTATAGLAHAWMTLRQDPMVFMAWNDMGVFTAIVLVWLARDLRARGRAIWWWPATLIMGCPPLLVYLATGNDASRRGASLGSDPVVARAP